MSGIPTSVFRVPGSMRIVGPCFVLSAAVFLAACSNNVSRFDYPALANNADDGLTTSSLHPVPSQGVYASGGSSNTTQVVRQDLPPPAASQPEPKYQQSPPDSRQYASRQPSDAQRAPLPPRQDYQTPPPYEPPAPPAQANYQPSVPEKPKPQNKTVRVERGDTLYKLAHEHGVTVEEIKEANDLRSTRLSIDQKLIIPVDGAPPVPEGPSRKYTVARGDSVARIANDQDVDQEKLIAANDLRYPYTLQPGQVLKIPGKPQPAVASNSQEPVRVASRGADIPLPSNKPAPESSASVPDNTSIESPRPQKKVASRTPSLPKPEPMAGNQFRWPVKGRIIAGYGPKENGKHNDGVNVAVPRGTSIKAAENGVVAYAGSELAPYGNLVLVRHANNWVTAYAHNDELLVKRGDTVRRGQVIAKAGQSGNVSQPQLHFELRKGSKPVDPLSYMASSS